MARYHPVSYETEARIRQDEKLANAHRYRQLKTARATRPRPGAPLLRPLLHALHVVVTLLVTARM